MSYRKYDVIVGGIRSEYSSNFTDFIASAPYMQDDLTWCVSKAKALPQWQNIYYIVRDVPTIIFGSVSATIFVRYVLSAFEKNPRDINYCATVEIQILAGVSSAYKPKESMAHFHFGIALIVAFSADQIFSGFLIIYFQRIL